MKKYRSGERILDISINIFLVFIGVLCMYPIWYVLIASISSPTALAAGEVLLFPKDITFSAYQTLFKNNLIWIGYKNSIINTTLSCILDTAVMALCAYALSRRSLPGRSFFMLLFVITMYFSGGLIPQYLLNNSLGLVNTRWVLIIPGCVNVYNMILAKSYFENNVPDSLFDAARIDGASYTRFFIKIVLPVSGAILAIIALFSITIHWNAYLGAQMYLYDEELYTLQQVIKMLTASVSSALAESLSGDELARIIMEKSLIKYAVVIVGSIPLVIAYPFVQKYFVRGVMVGAVKG